jgi:hypothetical protein
LKFVSTETNHARLMALFGIIISIAWINSVYGQSASENAFPQFPTVPSSSNNTSTTKVKTNPSTQPQSSSEGASSSIKHGVRITSPIRDQQVPAGAILTISGISKDNATSDCHVNVNVNHVRPYQNTSANGPGGPNDYSNWTFSLTPKYTVIKQGVNEITAKFYCNLNPDIASFYSMNVTGVQPAGVQGGQTKMASATSTTNSSITTANVTNQSRTIVSK